MYLGQFEGLPIEPGLRVYEPQPYDEVQRRHIAGLLSTCEAISDIMGGAILSVVCLLSSC